MFTFEIGSRGQLGNGDDNGRDAPVEVGVALFRGARIVYAAAGGYHSGVKSEGGVRT